MFIFPAVHWFSIRGANHWRFHSIQITDKLVGYSKTIWKYVHKQWRNVHVCCEYNTKNCSASCFHCLALWCNRFSGRFEFEPRLNKRNVINKMVQLRIDYESQEKRNRVDRNRVRIVFSLLFGIVFFVLRVAKSKKVDLYEKVGRARVRNATVALQCVENVCVRVKWMNRNGIWTMVRKSIRSKLRSH